MKVLILCETSGKLRRRFYDAGHEVMSCDLLPCDDPEHVSAAYHYVGDVFEFLSQVGKGWNLIVVHPPCTALALSGNRWYGKGMPRHEERLKAIEWTMSLWEKACSISKRVAMENPVGMLPIKATQYIQPWQFGHGETKKTGLWLHNLPKLEPTNIVEGREARIHKMPPSPDRWKKRSETFDGIADAIADQWEGVDQ